MRRMFFCLSWPSSFCSLLRVPRKVAKTTPLYKKGPMLDPNSYRMLAVIGTIWYMYVQTVRKRHSLPAYNLVHIKKQNAGHTVWLLPRLEILQPMFIFRYLQHAVRTIKPSNSSRPHTAFIDFKQANDTVPRQALWLYFRRIRMPANLLSALQSLYADDQYLLQDGHKAARVKPTVGVKQGCPLSSFRCTLMTK